MTEQEWLQCTDFRPMLDFLQRKVTGRKLRLFGCACCRRIWDLLKDERVERAVLLSEQVADGRNDTSRLQAILATLQQTANGHPPAAMVYQATMGVIMTAWATPDHPLFALGLHSLANAMAWNADPGATVIDDDWASPHDPGWRAAWAGERKEQARLLHDVIVNPFRPACLDPDWQTPEVQTFAQAIYDERAFEQLPNLAAALEEASCTDAAMLAHLRGLGPHVRGCWAVDLILGKE